MHHALVLCFAFLIPSISAGPQEITKPIEASKLREAATKALRVVQESQRVWYKRDQTCASCHHQILPIMAQSIARQRGLEFDEKLAHDVTGKSFSHLKDLDAILQGYDYIDDVDEAWKLIAAHAACVPPNYATSAVAQYLASAQRPDGSWYTMDGRPPQSYSRITTTATAYRALRLFLPDALLAERNTIELRARSWLLLSHPHTTEEHAFKLLGLHWTGAHQKDREEAARRLLALQRADGGWAQLPSLASDAYSTGEALYALHTAAGFATGDPPYQRGLSYLLKTQESDGSWRVPSRLHPSIPLSPDYFSSGFPHGRLHQYSSITGTNWATIALMLGIPFQGAGQTPPATPDLAPAEKDEWIAVVLTGSADDLKKALNAGMPPNSKTARGTTALMLAARDADKVKLLLDRGANVNARAESGLNALIVAARYHGNTNTVGLLLKHGAKVNADKGVMVKNNASAIFNAATNGDAPMVRMLLDTGADINDKTRVLGGNPLSAIASAAQRGDAAMVDALIERGANPNDDGTERISVLMRATVNNHLDTVKLLLSKGAKVNHKDDAGWTALLYAAYLDSGSTAVLETLLAAGADPAVKDDQGRTALEAARAMKHDAIASVLAGKSRPR